MTALLPSVVVDASVWVSRLTPADIHHAVSREWMGEHVGAHGLLVAPVLLLAEVAGAIARRTDDTGLADRTVQGMLRLAELRMVEVDQQLGLSAARLAATRRIRGADAIYLAVAESLNIPLVTWDQEQVQRTPPMIAVYTPQDLR